MNCGTHWEANTAMYFNFAFLHILKGNFAKETVGSGIPIIFQDIH